MLNKSSPDRRGIFLLLLLTIAAALVACGDQQAVKPRHTPTPTATNGAIPPTATPATARIAYPWPMKQHQLLFSQKVVWVPVDTRVYQELQTDFLSYWAWSGQAGPTSFPFLPDTAQIPVLATPDFSAMLQNYVAQIQSSRQVTAYLAAAQTPSTPLQTLKGCTQDGLQCQGIYVFSRMTRTTYDTNTGKILSQTANLEVAVFANQSYNKEMQRWQLSNVMVEAIPA